MRTWAAIALSALSLWTLMLARQLWRLSVWVRG